jgi:hypothetical protein
LITAFFVSIKTALAGEISISSASSTGSFRIPEIGIYHPHIYLTEKKGLWNTARLMKESKKKPEEKKPERKAMNRVRTAYHFP